MSGSEYRGAYDTVQGKRHPEAEKKQYDKLLLQVMKGDDAVLVCLLLFLTYLSSFSTNAPRTKTLHFTSLHFTSLHFTSLHFTSLHFISLHFTSLHFTSLHFTSLHFTSLHFTSLHFTSLYCVSILFTALNRTGFRAFERFEREGRHDPQVEEAGVALGDGLSGH
jgi:hypothetical protein